MPVNRNALIRYKTIDKCLQNHYRKWTLEDLIDACSEALYEYEGIDKGVSRRTIQADIQLMRSDKLGYNAPIIVVDKKYYCYEDKGYSITNIPLSNQDLEKLSEVVEILKQFKGFSHFKDLGGMVQKLEDKVYTEKSKQAPIIDIEKNENLKGLEFLEPIYAAISQKKAISIVYQSFRARKANGFIFYPYLLKEYRNRWFVLGKKGGYKDLLTLALDRVQNIDIEHDKHYVPDPKFSAATYFKDVIGVTVNPNQRPVDVHLFIDRRNAPYILTKPLHSSQKLIEKLKNGIEISIQVIPNYELEREILGYGDSICVLSPLSLRKRIEKTLCNAKKLYSDGA